MLPRTYARNNCSIARTLEVVGDRWTLLIVRNALVGISRFDEFQAMGVAPNVLADRLTRLCDEGILKRTQYCERPARYAYNPTDKGRELWPVLTALMEWGDRYHAPRGAPRLLLHSTCGHRIAAQLRCPHCATAVAPDEVTTAAGPGA